MIKTKVTASNVSKMKNFVTIYSHHNKSVYSQYFLSTCKIITCCLCENADQLVALCTKTNDKSLKLLYIFLNQYNQAPIS